MKLSQQVEVFLGKYGHSEFPYAREVLELLRDQAEQVPGLSIVEGRLTPSIREIFRNRAVMAVNNPDARVPNLGAEAMALAERLAISDDQPMRSWWLPLKTGGLIVVFELITDSSIAGCMETLDIREVALD